MANLLSREQADLIIQKAIKECEISGSKLGATICKYLTLKQISNIISPEKDIFYIKDNDTALKLFIKYCVEEEIISES